MTNKSSFILNDTATVKFTDKNTGETIFEGELLASEVQIIPPERPEYAEITFKNGSKLIHPKSAKEAMRGKSSENILIINED